MSEQKTKFKRWIGKAAQVSFWYFGIVALLTLVSLIMYWVGVYKVYHHPITKEAVLKVIDESDIEVTTSDTSKDGEWIIFNNKNGPYNLAGRYQVFDNSWDAENLYNEIYLEVRRLHTQEEVEDYEFVSRINCNLFEVTTSKAYSTCYQKDNVVFFITVNVDEGKLPDDAVKRADLILKSIDYPTKDYLEYMAIRFNSNNHRFGVL